LFTCLYPVSIAAFELVAVSVLAGDGVVECDVLKFEVVFPPTQVDFAQMLKGDCCLDSFPTLFDGGQVE